MKKSSLVLAMAILFVLPYLNAQKKQFKETIKKEFNVNPSQGRLIVKNVFGSITIEGYSGNSVLIEVQREISARTQANLELGKKELQVKFNVDGNRVIARPDAPYITFDNERLSFDWCNHKGYDEIKYEHHLTFRVKVPKGISVQASTVNDGEIYLGNVSAPKIKVSNINGGIELNNVVGKTDLHCINGDVTVSYAQNPSSDSTYYALNGDINISYQNGLSANVSFKSMNGDLFTDFDIEKTIFKVKKD